MWCVECRDERQGRHEKVGTWLSNGYVCYRGESSEADRYLVGS